MSGSGRAGPLRAARAGLAACWALALGLTALLHDSPLVLAAVLVAVAVAAAVSGCGRPVARAAALAVPLSLLVALVNPLVTRDGLTVVARLGEVPVLGRLDLTAEAFAYGGVLGLRVLALALLAALFTAVVDPDELLRGMRRVSFRSALTASLATRMVPVLARDGARLAEARRTLPPGTAAPRAAVVRAVAANALDRAVDVAAALELRGYGGSARPSRPRPRPWSRDDARVASSALAVAALAIAAHPVGAARFVAYPSLRIDAGPTTLALAAAVVAAAVAPLAARLGAGR